MSEAIEEIEVLPVKEEDQLLSTTPAKDNEELKVTSSDKKIIHLSKSFMDSTPNSKPTGVSLRDTSESKSRSDKKADIEVRTTLALIDELEKQNTLDFKVREFFWNECVE